MPVAVEGEPCLILDTEHTEKLEDEEVQPEQLSAPEVEEKAVGKNLRSMSRSVRLKKPSGFMSPFEKLVSEGN